MQAIQGKFPNNEVEVFRVANIGNLLKVGIMFDEIDDLLKLVSNASLNRIFVYEHFVFPTDYYITEQTMKNVFRYENSDFIEFVIPQIEEYNSMVENLDFEYPSMVITFCACDNQWFFVAKKNERLLDGEELLEPEEMLQIIRDLNEGRRNEIINRKRQVVESLQEELHQQILNDEKFKVCTNQELRSAYGRKLFSKLGERFEPLKEIMYQHNLSVLSREGREFIEVIWREVLESKKK